MKTILLKSNHGNHTGFNRKWAIDDKFNDVKDAKKRLMELAFMVSDNVIDVDGKAFETNLNDFIYEGEADSFEYDLVYYRIFTQEDYDNGYFDGGHNGYAPKEVVEYFENEE